MDGIELRRDVRDAQAVVVLRDELAERVGEGEGVLGFGVNDESGEVDGTRGGFAGDFGDGDVEDWTVRLAQVAVRDVGGDADNRVDGFVGAAFKGVADGVLAGEESFDEGLVDDGAPGDVSSGRKSRPETRRIFMVESQPGETGRNHAGVGLGGAPLMEISLFMRMRPRRGQLATATESMPGMARSASAV